MFRDRRQRHGVWPREIGNAPVATCQMRQDAPPSWIGQGGESSVQRSRRIFNHLVNYVAELLQHANIFFATIFRSRQFAAISSSERFFIHHVRHSAGIAAVFSFEDIDESLDTAPSHAFIGVDIQTCDLCSAGKMME